MSFDEVDNIVSHGYKFCGPGAKLERQGRLPERPAVDPDVVGLALARLEEEDEEAHMAAIEEEEVALADADALCAVAEELGLCEEMCASACLETMHDAEECITDQGSE